MPFDQNIYAALASNPDQQAAYLAQFTAPAAPAVTQAPVPPVNFQAPPASVSQAQPQAYANPAAVQQAPVLARGTLEDFYNQPSGSGGGPSVTSKFFTKRVQGSWLQLRVVSDVTNADVRQQTTPQGIPQTFKDGKPKFVLVVKVQVLGSSDGTHATEFPDGLGSLWVKGVLADELRRAMAAAGDDSGYPKAGADIVMVSAGEQASRTPGFSATKLYQLQYAPSTVVVDQNYIPSSPLEGMTWRVDPTIAATQTAPVTPVAPTASVPPVVPVTVAEVPTVQAPVPSPVPSAVPAPPVINDDKAALLAKLQGNG